MSGVAIGWRVHDNLKSFPRSGWPLPCAAIQRAHISGRRAWRLTRRNVAKFRMVIVGEKHIVMVEIKTLGFRMCQPYQR